jgi:hypothetical protein
MSDASLDLPEQCSYRLERGASDENTVRRNESAGRESHAQALGAQGHAIVIAWHLLMPVLIEGYRSNAAMASGTLIDVPGIKGRIGGDMRGREAQGDHGALIERPIVAHIALVKGLGILGQHHIPVVSGDRGSHAGAIAPQVLLDLFGRAIGLLLVGTLFDPELAVRITCGLALGW